MNNAPAIHIAGHYDIDGQPLFDPVNLTLPAGRWTCILGRSGVGKSTLLRLTAGLDCGGAFHGHITPSDDRSLTGRVCFMTQSDQLLPWLSVIENTVLGARLRGVAPDFDRAHDLLERVGLAAHCAAKPAALSGGMRQRTALARSLMEDRPVVLLDEPFSALDASTRADMQELAARLLYDKTVLMVTHDPAEAVRLGHQILVLTPLGVELWQLPETPPIRDQYVAETVECQAALLIKLRGLA